MRTIFDHTGADITNLVSALMLTTNEIFQNELFAVSSPLNQNSGTADLPKIFLLTDCENPVQWSPITGSVDPRPSVASMFFPAAVKRDAIEFELGLTASDFKITWSSPTNVTTIVPYGSDAATALPVIECFRQGAFDNGAVKIWRMFSDGYGGAGALGIQGVMALQMGRIADVTIDPSGKCEITCRSYLDQLDQQVPRYIIQANNRINQLGLVSTFNAQGQTYGYPSSPALNFVPDPGNTLIRAAMKEAHGLLYPEGTFDGMYIQIAGAPMNRVAHSWSDFVQNYITLVRPLRTPISSVTPTGVNIWQSRPLDDQGSPGGLGTLLPGFPYVLRPEDQF